ncbi:TIGR04086 family membrane protein [Clostridium malenominatum]|uniref:TIGR04086 family membrane protein n=1 Tax=Clostridium malenominatum TaxID=1539 RepID=A0ABN1J7B1_9CLOT
MERSNLLPIGDGILRSTILTVVFMIIYAIIMTIIDLSDKANSIFYLVTTVLSIMYGSIYAVRKINKKGWLTGMIVATLYMLIIYVVSLIAGNTPGLDNRAIMKFLLALGVGALSGMLGINI